jgi:hypothetical protein
MAPFRDDSRIDKVFRSDLPRALHSISFRQEDNLLDSATEVNICSGNNLN